MRRPTYNSTYRDNSLGARLFRGAVHKAFKPSASYHTAVGSRNYSKTKRAIRSGTFRGYYFRNGKNAPR